MKKVIIAAICAAGIAAGAQADNQFAATLKAKGEVIKVYHDGKMQPYPWVINTNAAVDTLLSTARRVTLITPVDTVTVSTGAEWQPTDIAVVTEKGDTAVTRVLRMPENIYNNPPETILKRGNGCMLSKEQAQFDVNALLSALNEIHPDLYFQTSQTEILDKYNEILEAIPDSIDTKELYMLAAPLVSMIGDGHTMLRFPMNDLFTRELKRLPMFVKVNSDRSVECTSCIDSLIPNGAKILSINGTTTADMIERLLTMVSGEREHFKLRRMDDPFIAVFETVYGGKEAYDVEFTRPGSTTTEHAMLPATKIEDMRGRMSATAEDKPQADYSYSIDEENGIAVMDFRRFNDPASMKLMCDLMMNDMKSHGIRKLIIDIRENGGGNSQVGDVLLRYISPRPFRQMDKTVVKRSPLAMKLTGQQANYPSYTYYKMTDKQDITPLTEEEGHFDGEVIVLTSNKTFSAASSFAQAFKHYQMGKTVGEETGGMTVTFGDIVYWSMPVSGIMCSISWKRFWHAGGDEKNIHGTLPDIEVSADNAMETAKAILKNSTPKVRPMKNENSVAPRYSSINNYNNATTIVLTAKDNGTKSEISNATLHTAGKSYKAKSVKQSTKDGERVYELKFKHLTEFMDTKVSVTIDGKQYTVECNRR